MSRYFYVINTFARHVTVYLYRRLIQPLLTRLWDEEDQFQKITNITIVALWCIRNPQLHRELEIPTLTDFINSPVVVLVVVK